MNVTVLYNANFQQKIRVDTNRIELNGSSSDIQSIIILILKLYYCDIYILL